MIRPIFFCAALILLSATASQTHAQAPTEATNQATQLAPMDPKVNPAFEVATIRPTKPGSPSQGFHLRGHRVFLENEPITSLICVAYGIHKTQIVGAPAWFDTDPYDIDGVPDAEGEPTFRQIKEMIQKLLADRFAIKFHHEKRELSIYALAIAKGGPRMTQNTSGREGQPDDSGNGSGSQMSMKYTNNTMADFALEMQFQVGKPVVDQTGLPGRYDFSLNWTKDDAHLNDPNAAPGFFTAIQEQIGLKLEAKKGLADVLVIDHAELPSEH